MKQDKGLHVHVYSKPVFYVHGTFICSVCQHVHVGFVYSVLVSEVLAVFVSECVGRYLVFTL